MLRFLYVQALLFLCVFNTLQAQQIQTIPQKVSVAYQPGSSDPSNEIIKILAQGNGKSFRNTTFTVNSEQVLNIQVQPALLQFTIRNKAFTVNGDVMYRGFDIHDDLLPAAVSYTLKISGAGFNREIPLTAKIVNGKAEDNTASLRDSGKHNFSYSLVNYKLNYTAANASAVKEKARLADLYFDKTTLLDQHYALLQAIDPYDYAAFRRIMPGIDQAQKVYDDIIREDLLNKLNAANDPARLEEKLTAYNALLQAKRATAMQVFSTLHLVFYERGNDAMRDGNNPAAYDLYHASLEVNPAFAPSMLQLARIDFIRGELKEAQCKADEIIYRMLPDPATRSNTLDLLQNIKDAYVDKALSAIGYKKYPDALELLAIAKDLCQRYPEMKCNDEIRKGIAKAHTGIYNDYLQEARMSIAKNDFEGAEKKVGQAISYYTNHLEGEPTDAFVLQAALRQKEYDNLCASGRQLTDRGDYENAVKNFTEADNLQRQYNLQKAADYDKTTRLAAGKFSTSLLSEGENAVALNNIPKAKQQLQEVIDLQSRFGLSNDAALNKKADALRGKIYTRQCANAQHSIDSVTVAAKDFLKDKLFLPAMLVLESGLQVKKENADCKLASDSMEALLMRIRPAGIFLQLVENSNEAVRKENYSEALRLYNEAKQHYESNAVAAYGIKPLAERDEFFLQTGNNGMLQHLAYVDLQQGNLDHSLRLYRLVLNRGANEYLLSDQLYELGKKTGQQDYRKAPGGKAKKLAARYTQDDKRLKRFVKGYQKGYRR